MINGIRPVLDNIVAPASSTPAAAAAEKAKSPFADAFHDAVARVNAFQERSDTSVNRFLSGENEEVHQVALDAQRAELAFDLFMQTRNKVVQAYQEIMRMQL